MRVISVGTKNCWWMVNQQNISLFCILFFFCCYCCCFIFPLFFLYTHYLVLPLGLLTKTGKHQESYLNFYCSNLLLNLLQSNQKVTYHHFILYLSVPVCVCVLVSVYKNYIWKFRRQYSKISNSKYYGYGMEKKVLKKGFKMYILKFLFFFTWLRIYMYGGGTCVFVICCSMCVFQIYTFFLLFTLLHLVYRQTWNLIMFFFCIVLHIKMEKKKAKINKNDWAKTEKKKKLKENITKLKICSVRILEIKYNIYRKNVQRVERKRKTLL